MFYIRKKTHTKPWGNRVASACVYVNDPATGIVASGAGRHGWAPTNSDNLYGGGDGGVCACVRACMHDVFAIYHNNILPRLIMIIIKIIILYFIQIRHTDDFPSTGTRLVIIIILNNILHLYPI